MKRLFFIVLMVSGLFLFLNGCGPKTKPKDVNNNECGDNEKYCNETCVNIMTDPNNCGDCGNQCAEGEVCEQGTCKEVSQNCEDTCTGPNMTCCNNECVNIMTDNDNCGGCGNKCESNEICNNGNCVPTSLCDPPCEGGLECCQGRCVDPNTAYDNDFNNCGYCGNACDPDVADRCLNGQCACGNGTACRSGFKCCESNGVVACRSVMSDPNNCGECGHRCNPGETCENGECKCNGGPPCNEGEACCNDGCRNVMDDPNNCGGCNIMCDPVTSDSCVNGECRCGTGDPCTFGFQGTGMDELLNMYGCMLGIDIGLEFFTLYNICCNGQCIPLDENNCGECGRSCGPNEECSGTLFEPPMGDGGYIVDGGFMDPDTFFKCKFNCYATSDGGL